MGHPCTHRFWKELIIKESELKDCETFTWLTKEIFETIDTNLDKLLKTRAVFLMIGYIEADTTYK